MEEQPAEGNDFRKQFSTMPTSEGNRSDSDRKSTSEGSLSDRMSDYCHYYELYQRRYTSLIKCSGHDYAARFLNQLIADLRRDYDKLTPKEQDIVHNPPKFFRITNDPNFVFQG